MQRQTIPLDLGLFEDRLQRLKEQIEDHLPPGGRQPRIVIISKYLSPEDSQLLRENGHLPLGENRAQELIARSEPGVGREDWHFVGHLQRNKISQVVPRIGMLHSLDSPRIAKAVHQWLEDRDTRQLPCLVQVNISGEEKKGGLDPSRALLEIPRWVEEFPALRIEGLMTMAPRGPAERCRGVFRMLRDLRDRLQEEIDHSGKGSFEQLSMGMSSDWEIAVEEGATMLRIGRMLYGDHA